MISSLYESGCPVHPKASRKPNHVSSADWQENDKLFRPLGIGYQPQS